MKKIIFIILLLSSTVNSQPAQQWVQRYNGPGNDFDAAYDIKTDDSGNVYVTGAAQGSSGSQANYVTIKYNSNGVQKWIATYNGAGNDYDAAYSLAVDKSGNVYVTGTSLGSVTGLDIVTVKYNSNGIQQWAAIYNGPVSDRDAGNKICLDDSGNVYITGSTIRTSFTEDFVTIKYNPSGVQQWISFYNGPSNSSDIGRDIKFDGKNSIYVTGESWGLRNDFVIIKYNKLTGDSLWCRRYDNGYGRDDLPKAIIADSGAVYVTGFSDSSGANYSDILTLKYDASGNFQWAKKYNGSANSLNAGFAIGKSQNGNIYVGGYCTRTGTSTDYALIKYNFSGNEMWAAFYNGPPGNGQDRANAMAIDGNENIYLTGYSWNTSFGSDKDYATVMFDSTGQQKWAVRYDGPGVTNDEATAIALDNSGNIFVTGFSKGAGINREDYATIKYSAPLILNLTAFIEGFYNQISHNQVSDTIKIYLRNVVSPYAIIDSAAGVLSITGNVTLIFNRASSGQYYIVIHHRNSLETWSKAGGESFVSGSVLNYNFSNSSLQAFGNNVKQVDASPVRFADYSGDVNQDGLIDLTDVILIYNDASGFVTGYFPSDLTGNNITDLTDILIAYNNSNSFVNLIRP